MNFADWLTSWLARHPLKPPSEEDRVRYTAEVMERVKALAPTPHYSDRSRAPNLVRGWGWPRLGLALAAAAAAFACILGLHAASQHQLAQRAGRDAAVLAALGEPEGEPFTPDDMDALADDLELSDTLTLAESPSQGEAWLERTLQLLQDVDDESMEDLSGSADPSNPDEWLEDLRDLDESEFAAHS